MTAKPIIACLALLVLAACSQSEPPVALQDPNPGFERMKGETVFGWASEGPSGRAWTPVADPVYSGRHALALAPSSTPGAVRLVSAPFAVTRGDWVKLEAWVRPPDKDHFQGRAYIEIKRKNRWHVLGVPATGSAARDWQPNDRSWIPWICHAFVPEGIQQARSVFEAQCGADVLEPWVIDDFSFRIGSLETYLDNAQSTERLDDVMLVGVDTLAQRFLSCYGADVHTPVIQRLAEEGKTFLHVMPAAPWTRPSFTSIFTSLYPSQHANDVLNAMIPDDVTTMAQLLKQRGYFTVAFARTSYDGQLGPGVHFDKGFDIYCHTDDEDYLFDMARSFLKENNANLKRLHAGGIFIFYHFQEPHSPYVNRNPKNVNRGLLGTVPITPEIILDTLRHPDPSTSNEYDGQYARACYASEIEFVDSRLGALFDDLDAAGLYDGLNIVFTADHGESFGEKDGVWLHGNPYNTTTLRGRRQSGQLTGCPAYDGNPRGTAGHGCVGRAQSAWSSSAGRRPIHRVRGRLLWFDLPARCLEPH